MACLTRHACLMPSFMLACLLPSRFPSSFTASKTCLLMRCVHPLCPSHPLAMAI